MSRPRWALRNTTPQSSLTMQSMPEIMPVLGRGRHRSPKSGACFMEFASWLAGERWSDHPRCTHSALAALARLVNDCSSDAARAELVTLIPSVVGLTGDGQRTSVIIAMRAAAAALPVVSVGRQRALAAGAMRCLPLLTADSAAGAVHAAELVNSALETVPDAEHWAGEFVRDLGPIEELLIERVCDAIIRTAVIGIAEACISDPDVQLRLLLASSIDAVIGESSEQRLASAPTLVSATAR